MRIEKENFFVEDTNDNLVEEDGKITCGCGNPYLTLKTHIDFTDKAVTIYVCKCGNEISTTEIREMEW